MGTNNTQYMRNHKAVYKARGKAKEYECSSLCGKMALDWALIHGKDGSDVMHFIPLCRFCHTVYDGNTRKGAKQSQKSKMKMSEAKEGRSWSKARREAYEARWKE
jgi:hypothetical protein